jgi:hypothetical protein
MQLRIKQAQDEFTADGHWIKESAVTPAIDNKIGQVLADHTQAGDEAVAYLLTVYMGEETAEELVCEVIDRGKRMVPLVRLFQAKQPPIGLEPLPKFVRGSGYLPGMVLKGIASGKGCSWGP